MKRRLFLFIGVAITLILMLSMPLQARAVDRENRSAGAVAPQSEEGRKIEQSTRALRDIMVVPEQNIPPSIIQEAAGVAIIPDVVRAAFIVGGQHGRGVLLTRSQDDWSPPVFVSITGGSVGAQIGAESSDLVLVFRKHEDMQRLIRGENFSLGTDASVAAGPVGRTVSAPITDADVLTYRRTGGLFAGVSLTGGVLSIDQEATRNYYDIDQAAVRAYYGEPGGVVGQILEGNERIEQVPEAAQELQQVLKNYASTTQESPQRGGTSRTTE